jgi:hypothetical protein
VTMAVIERERVVSSGAKAHRLSRACRVFERKSKNGGIGLVAEKRSSQIVRVVTAVRVRCFGLMEKEPQRPAPSVNMEHAKPPPAKPHSRPSFDNNTRTVHHVLAYMYLYFSILQVYCTVSYQEYM